ncbi:hypothetical protein JTE90_006547 [Oedothorax gibbosus]|uniref:Flavin-containing monooxygenase n=1 Tax=Oedothorax gibbosus TaxID=931172 RepID=A0AAV6VL78_9ARAC|nr:hypothetical protein JTE90_006547 [Oedothorax gibbosus]
MGRDIAEWCKACLECQKNKIHRHTKSAIGDYPLPSCRFSHINVDVVGPLPTSCGFSYVLTCVDRFSRWPEAFPMVDQTAATIAETFFAGWISRFGVPECISTDQGRSFESDLCHALMKFLGTEKLRTTAYNPASNGLVERFHRQLKQAIRCQATDKWVQNLKEDGDIDMRSKWYGVYCVNRDFNTSQDKKESSIRQITFRQKESEENDLNKARKESSKNIPISKKRIAVIGAGCVGLTTVIQLKDEGFEPVCYEKTDRPGGTWCYREESYAGLGSIMPTTIINHSKELGAYSNFPPAKKFNNYMRHSEMYQYFMEYWTTHDCLKHVRFNMETTSIRRSEDYDQTGRWVVTVRDTVSGQTFSEVYDAVAVCVGHINRPKIPNFPGLDSFEGRILHTHTLKGVEKFRGERVAVVGIGCSALDAAVETSNVAKQVYLSTKTGALVMTRVGPGGYPMDYKCMRRYLTGFLNVLPRSWCSWFIEKVFVEPKFKRKMYTINPKYPLLCKDPVINDHIGSKLLSGSIVQKGNISHFTENGVVFVGDEHITEVDTVIMATGYTWKFPFLEEDIVLHEDGVFQLYKCTFPMHLKHPTLALVGFILVWGPGFPLGEMQARWVASVFAGKFHLPNLNKMEKDTKKRYKKNVKEYAPSDKSSIRVDYVQFLDEIASLIGAKPNFSKLFFTDIKLFNKLIFGPSLSYQYRLQGPHKWKGAREAIFKCKERVLYPLRKERGRSPQDLSINNGFAIFKENSCNWRWIVRNRFHH